MFKWMRKEPKPEPRQIYELIQIDTLAQWRPEDKPDATKNFAVRRYWVNGKEKSQVEEVLVVHSSEPGWGVKWHDWHEGSLLDSTCYTDKEQCVKALERWFETEARNNEFTEFRNKQKADRGTVIVKYAR